MCVTGAVGEHENGGEYYVVQPDDNFMGERCKSYRKGVVYSHAVGVWLPVDMHDEYNV